MSFAKKNIGGSQHLGVEFVEGIATVGAATPATEIWNIHGAAQSTEFTRTGDISDTRKGLGIMGGHVVYGQENEATLTFNSLTSTGGEPAKDAITYGPNGGAQIQAGTILDVDTVNPSHYSGLWMIVELTDSHSNSEVTEWTARVRNAEGVDYSIVT